MVKRCCYGTCNSDTRYPERVVNLTFYPFPKPKTNIAVCLRWIKACGRPFEQLNVNKITKDIYVCSKHFVNGQPSEQYPDPIPATGGQVFQARRRPKKRKIDTTDGTVDHFVSDFSAEFENINTINENEKECQTEGTVHTDLDLLSHISRISQIEDENLKLLEENENLKKKLAIYEEKEYAKMRYYASPIKDRELKSHCSNFSADKVAKSSIKNLFQYYTGLTYARFLMLMGFLFQDCSQNPVTYKEKRKEVTNMNLKEQLFLVLCRLRNGLHVKDLAFRFDIKQQSVSLVFNSLIHYMYIKLGSLSYWPCRDIIIENMPVQYKQDFPSCLAIIDCTEIRTEKPTSLKTQSQCYSDYKSTTTMKSLVVVDPRGSIMFVSDLFSGSISDNEICKESGFYTLLEQLKDIGYINDNDSIMADKGFRIHKELEELKLKLNIPPMASTACQMSVGDVALTRKIAAHRIHVERSINQIKNFKLVNRRIPGTLFHNINEIWSVSCFLTNFQDTLVKL